jgi:hypothetical protein
LADGQAGGVVSGRGHLREVVSDLYEFSGQLFEGAVLVAQPVADLFG